MKIVAVGIDADGDRVLFGRSKMKNPVKPLSEEEVHTSTCRIEAIHEMRRWNLEGRRRRRQRKHAKLGRVDGIGQHGLIFMGYSEEATLGSPIDRCANELGRSMKKGRWKGWLGGEQVVG